MVGRYFTVPYLPVPHGYGMYYIEMWYVVLLYRIGAIRRVDGPSARGAAGWLGRLGKKERTQRNAWPVETPSNVS